MSLNLSVELQKFEERGIKFLKAFAQGDTAQGRSAKEKLRLIEQMRETHPVEYQRLLEKNYMAEHAAIVD